MGSRQIQQPGLIPPPSDWTPTGVVVFSLLGFAVLAPWMLLGFIVYVLVATP